MMKQDMKQATLIDPKERMQRDTREIFKGKSSKQIMIWVSIQIRYYL
jgi:hypothetical protein